MRRRDPLISWVLAAAIGWAVLSPAPALAGCDLAKVAGTLGSGLLHGSKRPELPVVKAQVEDFGGAYSADGKTFVKNEIVFSPSLEKETGIRKLTRIKMLGAGGVGVVYEVEVEYASGANRHMALKTLIDPDYFRQSVERKSLRIQYETAREVEGVSSPELLIDIRNGKAASNLAILSELEGASLFARLWDPERGLSQLSVPQRLKLAEVIAEQGSRILAGVHRRNIVHHDVNASNFMISGGRKNDLEELLSGKARLRLIDFGVASEKGDNPGYLAGTPAYFSRWMIKDPTHRPANDRYAFGMLLAEILTNREAKDLPASQVHDASQYPRPGFSRADVHARIDNGMRLFLKGPVEISTSPELTRLDRLEKYVLGLLGSGWNSGSVKEFAP